VVLADEPTGNLDTQVGHEILKLFVEQHRAGMTVVMITHNPEIAALGQRQLSLRDGEVTVARAAP
jgi:putative ABC transport system ATP-binding protein